MHLHRTHRPSRFSAPASPRSNTVLNKSQPTWHYLQLSPSYFYPNHQPTHPIGPKTRHAQALLGANDRAETPSLAANSPIFSHTNCTRSHLLNRNSARRGTGQGWTLGEYGNHRACMCVADRPWRVPAALLIRTLLLGGGRLGAPDSKWPGVEGMPRCCRNLNGG